MSLLICIVPPLTAFPPPDFINPETRVIVAFFSGVEASRTPVSYRSLTFPTNDSVSILVGFVVYLQIYIDLPLTAFPPSNFFHPTTRII